MRARAVLITILVCIATSAWAKPKVALPPFEDDDDGAVRDGVAEALDGDDFDVLGKRETKRAAEKFDLTSISDKNARKLSTDLGADVLVLGSVGTKAGKTSLKLRLYVSGKKAKGFSISFSNPKSAKFKASLHDAMVAKVEAASGASGGGSSGDESDGDTGTGGDGDSDSESGSDRGKGKGKGSGKVKHSDAESGDDENPNPTKHKVRKGNDDSGDGADDSADDTGSDAGDDSSGADGEDDAGKRKGKSKSRRHRPAKGGDDGDGGDGDGDGGDGGDGDGDGDSDGDGDGGHHSHRNHGSATPLHTANRAAVRIDLGASAANRIFDLNSRPNFPEGPKDYRNSVVPGGRLALELYPLAISNPRSVAAGLGLAIDYDKTLKLNVTSSLQAATKLPVNQTHFSIGARFRLMLGKAATAPSITLGLAYGRRKFIIDRAALMDQASLRIPDTDYHYIAPSLGFRVPLVPAVALVAGGDLMAISNAGPVQLATQYGQAKVLGVEAYGGLDFVFTNRVGLRITGEFAQVGFAFLGNGTIVNNLDNDPSSVDIGGAKDRSIGGAATIAVMY